jgi:hypothetical protein
MTNFVIRTQLLVSTHEHEAFTQGLRDDQTIEGIAMMVR